MAERRGGTSPGSLLNGSEKSLPPVSDCATLESGVVGAEEDEGWDSCFSFSISLPPAWPLPDEPPLNHHRKNGQRVSEFLLGYLQGFLWDFRQDFFRDSFGFLGCLPGFFQGLFPCFLRGLCFRNLFKELLSWFRHTDSRFIFIAWWLYRPRYRLHFTAYRIHFSGFHFWKHFDPYSCYGQSMIVWLNGK